MILGTEVHEKVYIIAPWYLFENHESETYREVIEERGSLIAPLFVPHAELDRANQRRWSI